MAICYMQDLYNEYEKRYPGLFWTMEKLSISKISEYDIFLREYSKRSFPIEEVRDKERWVLIFYLYEWSKAKIIYSFAEPLITILQERAFYYSDEELLPVQVLEHLPFKTFAIRTTEQALVSKNGNPECVLSENAFIGLCEPTGRFLHRTFTTLCFEKNGTTRWARLSIIPGSTIGQCLEHDLILLLKAQFTESQLSTLKKDLNIANFTDLKSEISTYRQLEFLREKHSFLNDKTISFLLYCIKDQAMSKLLIKIAIQYVFYLS